MLVALSLALAQTPPTLDAVAIELTTVLGGNWELTEVADATNDPGRTVAPLEQARVRLTPTVRYRAWSIVREVFATDEQAEAHVQAWARAGFPHYDDDETIVLWAFGHTKSWQRKLRQGSVVWEFYASCAVPEADVLALERHLEEVVGAEGSYGSCPCGGACSLGDDRDRWNPPDPPWPKRQGTNGSRDMWSDEPEDVKAPQ